MVLKESSNLCDLCRPMTHVQPFLSGLHIVQVETHLDKHVFCINSAFSVFGGPDPLSPWGLHGSRLCVQLIPSLNPHASGQTVSMKGCPAGVAGVR